MAGIRYIANRNHIKAIVTKLDNGVEGPLVQSPKNHQQQLTSYKEVQPARQAAIKKVEVIY